MVNCMTARLVSLPLGLQSVRATANHCLFTAAKFLHLFEVFSFSLHGIFEDLHFLENTRPCSAGSAETFFCHKMNLLICATPETFFMKNIPQTTNKPGVYVALIYKECWDQFDLHFCSNGALKFTLMNIIWFLCSLGTYITTTALEFNFLKTACNGWAHKF